MDETENYQFNYQKLLRFLTREGGGYTFVLVDDARYIRQVNESLKADLESKSGIKTGIIFLDEKSDEPVPHQLTVAAETYGVLLVANMYEIARDTRYGHAAITALNFNREAIQELPCKIVFWIQEKSLAFVANFAADLYVQRALSTIHFTGVIETIAPEMPQTKEWEYFLNSENFKDIEARIATFKRRLEDAENAGYPAKRIADEIALPLAADYAELGMNEKAEELLEKYLPVINQNDVLMLDKLADVYHRLHDLNKAIKYQEARLDVIRTEFSSAPDNVVLKNQAALALQKLGDYFVETGDFIKAELYFQHYSQISEQLYEFSPQSEQFKYELGVSYSKLGDVNQMQGRFAEAQKYFIKETQLLDELYESNPLSEPFKRGLAISYVKLGDVNQVQGRFEDAQECFGKGTKLFKELCQSNPQSESFKMGLVVSYVKLGDVNFEQDRFEEALRYFTKGNLLIKQLCKSNPQSESLKNELAISYERLGAINQVQGHYAEALEYFSKETQLFEELCESNPQSVGLLNGLAISYWKMGDINQLINNIKETGIWFGKAEKIWSYLTHQTSQVPEYQQNLNQVRQDLQQLQSA